MFVNKKKTNKKSIRLFVINKTNVKIKTSKIISNKVRTKRISKDNEKIIINKENKKEIKEEKQQVEFQKQYGNVVFFNEEYIENFICVPFSIVKYLKKRYMDIYYNTY